jgi:hypothetical protein
MHHIFLKYGLSAFFERLPHRLVRECVNVFQLDHPPGQEPQGPSRLTLGWGGAGQRDQLRLLLPVELGRIDALAAAIRAQRRRQTLLDKPPPQALDGGKTNLQRLGNALVRPARPRRGLVRLEQDLRVPEPAHIGLAPRQQPPEFLPLLTRQRHPIALHPPPPARHRQNNGAGDLSGHA